MKKAKIIVFTGIDGSGKGTMIDKLKNHPNFNHCIYLKKKLKDNLHRIQRLLGHQQKERLCYLTGNFAEAVRWAHGFDFLRFYENEVLPHLSNDKIIVSDRWSICYSIFSDVGTKFGEKIEKLLECIPPPDLHIHLDISPEIAYQRIIDRGDFQRDEHIEILKEYRQAYQKYLSKNNVKTLTIYNDNIENTYSQIIKKISHSIL